MVARAIADSVQQGIQPKLVAAVRGSIRGGREGGRSHGQVMGGGRQAAGGQARVQAGTGSHGGMDDRLVEEMSVV